MRYSKNVEPNCYGLGFTVLVEGLLTAPTVRSVAEIPAIKPYRVSPHYAPLGFRCANQFNLVAIGSSVFPSRSGLGFAILIGGLLAASTRRSLRLWNSSRYARG